MWTRSSSCWRSEPQRRGNCEDDWSLIPVADQPIIPSQPRLRQYQPNDGTWMYTIEADISPQNEIFKNVRMLFLTTTCVAVADYCLLIRRPKPTIETSYQFLDLGSHEYLEVCLRLKRCGATKVEGRSCTDEENCQFDFEVHVNKIRYLFGWPAMNGANEPVWVYYIARTSDLIPQNRVRSGGMEAQLERESLSEPTTMDEYREKLKLFGAVFYRDVRNSPEAWQMGLVRRPANLSEV